MGLKFRKSIKVAPGVKLNLNTKSSSVTLGTKGAHCTVNTTGKKTTSVGIPGTGISYVSTTGGDKKQETKSNKKTASKTSPTTKAKPSKGSSKKSSGKAPKGSTKNQPKKKGGCLATCLLIFTILCLIFAIIPSDDKKEETKNPLGFDVDFSSSYRNDVTGNWRLAKIAKNITIEEYALDYYHNYFESDDEIHIIINFTLNTTNRIIVTGNHLDVATMEYIDKEEHDAKIACSGMLLSEYLIDIDTGKIEKIYPQITDGQTAENTVSQSDDNETERIAQEQAEAERIAQEQAEAERIAQEQAEAERIAQEQAEAAQAAAQSQNTANNFNTYDNAEQQQTSSTYVLNTNTMKFHNPGCRDVKKIAPQNYSTYDGTKNDIMNQGYSPCGHCNP